jgi:aminocarboxymuconate-semialdehyde decarboxylase
VRPEGPAAIPHPPREYARRIYVDSLTLSPANLRLIVDVLGPERVVIGSDYPFDMGEDDPVGFVAGAGLHATVREAIESGNAVRFLGLA